MLIENGIIVVAGTRPEAIKLAPLIWELDRRGLNYIFIWSGQHYDYEMSKIFFEELGLPQPNYNLDVRSGSHAEQTSKIMIGLEKIVGNGNIIVAEGDTNTVLAAALVCAKTRNIFAHVEAGLRSYDRSMPEEINRIIAGSIAGIHFAPTVRSMLNLLYEGVSPDRIFITGNTIVDVVLKCRDTALSRSQKLLDNMGFREREYVLVTVHRAENVDNPIRLKNILRGLSNISEKIPLIFPVHPRTKNRVERYGFKKLLENLVVIKPIGYFEFLGLLAKSLFVITDSGGVQEEALTLKIPCITVRYNTERPETIDVGINFLVGADEKRIVEMANYIFKNNDLIRRKVEGKINPLGDGKAGLRIAEILEEFLEKDFSSFNTDFRDLGQPLYILIPADRYEGLTILDFHERFKGIMITLIYDG
ncbi:MAG TPA: UDP-N-acetylglucosamine 2-epimerase (non-hydrolyzing), partial [Thermoprotei archaeon]|nr:UDP-N-acetylglucosamine 2-epimerase (non-hydrolyzing) [Thermoprotei archaeon]